MDESFRNRADKIFRSLSASLSSSIQPPQPPSWSVAAADVERRKWRRPSDAPDRAQTPCASSFHSEFGIGASIGMDPTLDFEDEEDEYDKVASGGQVCGDDDERLFMGNVTRHNSYLNSFNVLGSKDLRANHLAARHRLREDDDEVGDCSGSMAPMEVTPAVVDEKCQKSNEGGGLPKPILKRKENTSSGGNSRKRVRFDPAFLDHSDVEELPGGVEKLVSDSGSGVSNTTSQVPDYLVNPSKYTCYSLDSTSDVAKTGKDFITQFESSGSEMVDASPEIPKSVTFVPKKKTTDRSSRMLLDEEDADKESLNRKGFTVSIAAMEENEVSLADEENISEQKATLMSDSLSKQGRKFRKKSVSDDESDS